MGELAALAESADEVRDATAAVNTAVARVLQYLERLFILQIAAQVLRAVEVKQHLSLQKTDGQKAQPLRGEQPVETADIRE